MEKELTLKEIQKGELQVAKVIDQICNDLGLRYFINYGTLLGAIRHHGFIPWDDDIDVVMPRNDYEIFVEYCRKNSEKMKPFELIHYTTEPNYIYPIARLSDSRYKSLRKESKMVQTKKQHALFDNCPFVCINFDFSWLNKARPGCRCLWAFNQTASAPSVAWIH